MRRDEMKACLIPLIVVVATLIGGLILCITAGEPTTPTQTYPRETVTETLTVTSTTTSEVIKPTTVTETVKETSLITTTLTHTLTETTTLTSTLTETLTKQVTVTTTQTPVTFEDFIKESISAMKFTSGFHATTRGMKYWYDLGFYKVTGIPYEKLTCKNCHATCETCHLTEVSENTFDYDAEKAGDMQGNCLTCHGRERFALKIIGQIIGEDAHFSKGMTCMDCHTTEEIHGVKFKEDGSPYLAYREPGFFTTDCTNCHIEGDAPKPSKDILEHLLHWYTMKNIHCTACHTKTVQTCYSCHFDGELEGVPHSKLHTPLLGWVFLLKYKGMIYPGNIMTLTYEAKDSTFLAWAPFFSHIVVEEGRHCTDCHGSRVVKDILEDKRVEVVWWNESEGKVEHLEGVIPVVEGVEYVFTFLKKIDYETGQVAPFKEATYIPEANVTVINFGEPLTLEDVEELS